MSEIHFACPGCQSTLTVPARAAGQTLPCPICEQKAVVPVAWSPAETGLPLSLPSRRKRSFSSCGLALTILLGTALTIVGSWAWFELGRAVEKDQESTAQSRVPLHVPTSRTSSPSSRRSTGQYRTGFSSAPKGRESLQPKAPPQVKRGSKEDSGGLSDDERQRLRNVLADLKTKRPKPEPVKPKLLTEKEYRIARGQPGVAILKNVSPNQAGERVLIYYKMIENVRAIMPRSARCVEREGWKQLLDKHPTEQQLDQLVDFRPHLRPLKDRELQKLLRARAGWVEREELFKQLHTITGDERDWSLLHPFDDLDRDSMLRVIRAAGKAKDKGYSVLSKEELDLLLRADQLEFLDTLLAPPPSVHVMMPSTTPEERRAEEEFKERKRKAAEAAALEQHKKEREEDKKREAVRQRQMKIDKEEKEANKLLRAALLLDGRGGFEKQVRQRLQEIIDKYPDTPSAQKAQRQLDKMAK